MPNFTPLYRYVLLVLSFALSYNVYSQCGGGTTITTYPYNESFESPANTADALTWYQGTGDDLNWVNNAAGTPSGGTGPSAASAGTRYMYVESSGNGTGYPNKTAFLDSPCFDLTGITNPIFSFDYHIYGADMGTLKLQISTDNGGSWTDSGWSQSGQVQTSSGAAWSTGSFGLDAYTGQTIRLRMHGMTSTGYWSDMAIDRINITDVPLPACTTVSTFPYTEGFETGIGAWVQGVNGTDDDFDWTNQTVLPHRQKQGH